MRLNYNKINGLLLYLTGLVLIKPFPKHSIRFAKKYFNGKKIDAIEIGAYQGKNAKDVLGTLNINKIYLIDPWLKYEEYEEDLIQQQLDESYIKAKNRLRNYNNKIIYLKDYSSKVVDRVGIVDFLYIDGNHSYEYVMEDLENYYPKVRAGGIVAGHDISWFSVARAIQDFCKKENLNFYVAGQDWWIVKTATHEIKHLRDGE